MYSHDKMQRPQKRNKNLYHCKDGVLMHLIIFTTSKIFFSSRVMIILLFDDCLSVYNHDIITVNVRYNLPKVDKI